MYRQFNPVSLPVGSVLGVPPGDGVVRARVGRKLAVLVGVSKYTRRQQKRISDLLKSAAKMKKKCK